MKYIKKLCGQKCYLSPVDPEYAEIVAHWSNDIEIGIRTGDASEIISYNRQRDFLESMSKGEAGHAFLIVEIDNDTPIGLCRLMHVDLINRTATLGIFIGLKDYCNKGIGTEATKLLLDYGFNIINLNNIWLYVFSFNENAIKIYKNIGFKEIGRRRKSVILGKKFYDEIYMDILADEFESCLFHKTL